MPEYDPNELPKSILSKTTQKLRSSDYELVQEITDKNNKWVDAEKPNRDRMFESIGAFMDIAGGSWPEAERADLLSKGRHPTSINIAQQKLQSLAGSIYSERWDYSFIPLDLNENSLTQGVKYWYYADKEQFNYDDVDRTTLMNGLLHCGYDIIECDYSIRHTGGIKFRSAQPGRVIPDPNWTTDDYKDWREAIEHFWMTAQDIVDTYQTDDPLINDAAMRDRIGGYTYEPAGDVRAFEHVPETWGSKYLVVQYRWLEKIRTTRLHAKMPDGEWLALPLTVDEAGVRDFLATYSVKSEDLKEFPYEDDILNIAAVCPQIAPYSILAKGKHNIQCGSIGIFPFTSYRLNGVNKGIMEAVLDIQRTLNYRQSKLDDVIAASAAGAVAVNLQSLPRGQRDLDLIKQNKTRPDFVFGVNGDPNRVMAAMPRGEVPESLFREMNSLIDLFDRVTPVTPALEGAAQKDESGVLFEMRHAVTKLGTLLLYERWKQHLMNKAEAWYNQAQITYKGQYRKVKDDMGNWIEFNSPVYRYGERMILNSTDELPRSRVVITLSTSSPTERFAKRMELFDTTKMLSGNPELFRRQIRFLSNQMLRSLEGLTPDQKQYLERIDKMEEIQDISEIMATIKELEGRGLNAEIMVKQAQQMLMQLQQPQGPPQGGGAPAGGEQGGPPESLTPDRSGGGGGPGMNPAAQLPNNSQSALEPGKPVNTRRGEFRP